MADIVEAQVESGLRTSHGFPGHLSMGRTQEWLANEQH